MNLHPENDEKNQVTIRLISDKIKEIKTIRYKRLQDIAHVNWRLQGELINKYWCATGKEKLGCNTIMELRHINSSPPSYTMNSIEMVCEMAKYHTNVQKINSDIPEDKRQTETINLLEDLPTADGLDVTNLGKNL